MFILRWYDVTRKGVRYQRIVVRRRINRLFSYLTTNPTSHRNTCIVLSASSVGRSLTLKKLARLVLRLLKLTWDPKEGENSLSAHLKTLNVFIISYRNIDHSGITWPDLGLCFFEDIMKVWCCNRATCGQTNSSLLLHLCSIIDCTWFVRLLSHCNVRLSLCLPRSKVDPPSSPFLWHLLNTSILSSDRAYSLARHSVLHLQGILRRFEAVVRAPCVTGKLVKISTNLCARRILFCSINSAHRPLEQAAMTGTE